MTKLRVRDKNSTPKVKAISVSSKAILKRCIDKEHDLRWCVANWVSDYLEGLFDDLDEET